jgi:hypothetical protein
VHEIHGSSVPNKTTLHCLIEHFHDTGSVNEKKHSGKSSVLSDESVENIH